MATETSDQSGSSDISIYKDLVSYPWDTDKEFQGGLSAILGNASLPEQIRELTLRAQCFYFSRKKKIDINFDGYKAYLATLPSTSSSTDPPAPDSASSVNDTSSSNTPNFDHENDLPSATTTADEKAPPPYPPSFAEIVALITAGATIPGIRDIPDTVLTDQGTKPVARKRRKPWEKDIDEETIQGGGTFGDHRDTIIQQEYPTDA
ncbi:hypothetical protein BOTNAR_0055g00050 [Botryotinia narcissicola]|uniref:Uncharacterized protein n=1 Tax=Botryotinia narcissicola TaxID=278944 RepID=A0A4Z1IZA3_9HELO|nr:hypothetical protein BOTNAR_0055g00050 [Botryotinia narcissicola]